MLTQLKRIVQEVNQIQNLDEALAVLAKRLQEAMKVDCCTIYLANYEKQHFLLMATEGLSKDAIGKVSIGFSEGLIGWIGQREEPINIQDAQSHPRFKHYPEVKEENYHAFMGSPIIHQRKVLGVLTVQQKRKRRFSEDEEAFLVTLAAQIALEIAHAEARGALNLTDDLTKRLWQKSLRGVPGANGLAIGEGFVPHLKFNLRNQILKRSTQSAKEVTLYREAVKKTRAEVDLLSDRMQGEVPEDVLAIFQLYQHLLDANSLGHEVEEKIHSGWDAASSLKMVVEHYANQFRSMEDPYMQERAVDVEDLGNRVLGHLMPPTAAKASIPEQAILVAEEVSASMLAEFPAERLKGIISMRGSNNSHAAILARAIGLPAVMGLTDVPLSLLGGKDILLDGYSGEVIVSPNPNIKHEFQQLIDEERELFGLLQEQAALPAQTQDGVAVELLINAGLSAELEGCNSGLGDGVGLYRTEVPFMMRERFPSEQEQCKMYRAMLETNPGKSITMRTLDVGGDKPLPYFPVTEENPFLGWRGIRLTLDHPEIFLVQVRAMLRASLGLDNLKIMLPMITSVNEVSEAKRLIRQAYYEVAEEAMQQGQSLAMPEVGVMLEVPAVLYQMPQLAAKVDFFSIGSNDLTQYLLAVDRNNARVSGLYDSYHPAVLRALKQICDDCLRLGKPVTLCGELASEPGGVILLLAMGYRKLSMNSFSLAKVKWVIRSLSLVDARVLLDEVLEMEQPQQVRNRINRHLEALGLGGLVRAGK
ncbi:phosphoenolpyruvate--protein phosphotransferase [Aliiglaciecola sp. CAU 1673]|uniref:phosphoenolpyruvate--protein phosphotransferase n=1 Tax=Aliiglaciecola sp. CAU 1673 TaxID=3032595 RepID=UPI0023DA0541|nr:phosphoenolpyruvate--protein phosphotransferase [Aliiglaciecola sp. CAU 1673]MDF2178994.1 phosphoenolpyruvate--protein phosphotransferase [Aliiglaciecola sp. CAU 1673]